MHVQIALFIMVEKLSPPTPGVNGALGAVFVTAIKRFAQAVAICYFYVRFYRYAGRLYRKGTDQMLKQLRENTKTILWIVVVAFVISIFAVWGANLSGPSGGSGRQDDNTVGSVDGQPITRTLYSNSFTQVYDQMKQQRGGEYEPNQMERMMMAEQAWEIAIQKILMAREIEKLDIRVSDAELVDFLRRNPHPTLQQVFRTEDGQFDYQAYLSSLSDPEVDWTELERWGRNLLPELKLQTYISS